MADIPKDTKQVLCAWCGKPLLGEIARPGDRAGWCHDCSTTYGDVAVIVCMKCGKVLGGILPGLHDSGYMIKKNDVLHARSCPNCTDDDSKDVVIKCPVVEFEKAMEAKYGRQP